MYPVLFTVGSIKIFSLSIFLISGWLVFSFIFWRELKNLGVFEARIFDLTFYGTIGALFMSRLVYILLHYSEFELNILRMSAIWITPGLSFLGAIFGLIIVMVILTKLYKVSLTDLFNSLTLALIPSLILGQLGSLLDGSVIGKPTAQVWQVYYLNHASPRHPVQLYSLISLLLIYPLILWLKTVIRKRKMYIGLLSIWFLILFSLSEFIVEFFKQNSIYLLILSLNQWVYLALLSEAVGLLFVKTGGAKYLFNRYNRSSTAIFSKFNYAYEQIRRRFSKRLSK